VDSATPESRLHENWKHAGRLLRGTAHEVNNQLGAILAYADLIALSPGCSPEIAAMAKDIAGAVRAGAARIDTLAALVSEDLATVETIHLNDLLPRVATLFRFELDRGGPGIGVTLPESVCAFPGVRTRVVRAFMQAIRFALGAAPGGSGLGIRVHATSERFVVEIGDCSGSEPALLDEVRDHVEYHHGTLTLESRTLRIEFPRDTGLIRAQ